MQDEQGGSTKFKIRRTQPIKRVVDYLENHEIVKDAAQQTYTVNGKVIDITSTPADLSLGEGDVVCVAPTQQTGDDDSPVDHTPATRTKSATAKG